MYSLAEYFPARFLREGVRAGAIRPVGLAILAIALLGIQALAASVLLPQAANASDPPGPCDDGYVAPTPVAVAVTGVPIEVASTTADYFVLYIRYGGGIDLPISVTLGEAGTTTLTDRLRPLAANRYRVEKYAVAHPADIDGDCIDDLTELADMGTHHPLNPAQLSDSNLGMVALPSHDEFETLSFTGLSRPIPGHYLNDVQYAKFWIVDTTTARPSLYLMNTNTTYWHQDFAERVGIANRDAVQGEIIFHPNVGAPDGSLGYYSFNASLSHRGIFWFQRAERVNEILATALPFIDNNLAYYPPTAFVDFYETEKEEYAASRVNVLLEEDILPDIDFIPLNQAEGYGRLRLMEDGDRPSPFDVAIYTSLPNDLPRVAGTITTVPQTPLSHVNLRAIQNNLPNAFIRDALKDEAIKPLIGKYVYYAVTGKGYTIREATKSEVDAHHESLRPQSVQSLQSDLTVTDITALADVSFDDWTAFGVKAANVAELTKLSLPDGTTPVGFAAPFYFYDQFMKQATIAKETILGKKKAPDEEKITLAAGTTLASAVTQMLAHSYFQTDADIQEEMLDDLRDAIKDAATPQFIINALTDMHAEYPDGQSLRYRSSTNNEDLPNFNGAGLYSSKTQDPDETADEGIDKSIKSVWASLWNHRAFLERDFHRIDHTTVYMGVLVHPNYSDELVNGVAVSYDPITFHDNAYYVNSQIGEDLVTNPEAYSQPEQLLLGATGAATVLSRSNLAPSDQLLMTDAQMRQLRSNLETIHHHFKTLYGVQDGDDFAIEIEFKITAGNQLAIKQARPWIFAEPLVLTPTVTIALSSAQVAEGDRLELTATRSGGVLSVPLTIGLTWSETGSMLKATKPASVTIPINQATTTISVPIADDQEDEHDSIISVSIPANARYAIGTPGSASATVTDDDLTQISVRAQARTVTEGSTADFTFNRSGSVLGQPLTVDITVTDSGSRLTGILPASVTFAANSATTSVSLATADDEVITDESVVTVQIDAGSGYGIADAGSAKVTVQDDEVPGPILRFPADHAVSDGTVYVVALNTSRSTRNGLRFSIDGPDTGAFILYGSAELLVFNDHGYDPPGDANQDGVYEIDFVAENSFDGRVGTTKVRMRFTVTNAELIALAEQQWDQSNPEQRAVLLPNVHASRLRHAYANLPTDVQAMALRLARQQQFPAPGPTVSIAADSDISEGGSAVFTVTADPAPAADLDVTVSVSQTGDFGVSTGSQTVTIPTSGSATLTLSTSDDSVDEADGSVTATIDQGSGYLVSWTAGTAAASITDDDAPSSAMPEISITAGSGIIEGGVATFTISANPAPAAALSVAVAVSQTGDVGVTPGSQTVTIPTSGSATLTVATTNDSAEEADGSVTVIVASGQDYTVSSTAGSATVAVSDDDVPEISITAGSGVTEGGNASFTVTASPAPAAALSVSVNVAQSGDYGVSTGPQTVTIPTTGSATLTVATSDDSVDETDGSVTATVNTGTGYTVSATAGSARVAVSDDDVSEIGITAGSGVTEGGNASFTVSADPAPSVALSVSVAVSQTGDYGVATGSQTVTIPTSGSYTLTIATSDDSVDEADGSVTVTVNTGSGYTVSATAGSATVAVSDDDDPPQTCTPNLPADAITVSEVKTWRGDYSHAAHVSRWNRVLAALGEDTGESAMSADDARTIKQQFDNSRWDRTVRTLDAMEQCADSTDTTEPPATPEVSISGGSGITEGGDASFTITANPVPASALSVTVAVSQTGDYGVATGPKTVTIPTGGTYTLTIATSDDSVDEVDGSVTVTVNTGSGYTVSTTAGSANVAVADDDTAPPATPEVSISGGSGITEGGNASFTITANPAPAAALSVSVTVSQTGDYGVATGSQTVTIPTSGSVTLTVATTNDSVDELDGSVTVTVNSGTGYDVSSTAGSATIAVSDDDDPPPPTPEVSISAGSGVTEGGNATFTVTANPAPTSPLSVTVNVAQSGEYGVATGAQTVTIPTSGSVTLTIATSDDSVDESNGSVTVTVNSGTGYDVSSSNGVATVAVSDDDDPPPPPPVVNTTPTLSIGDGSASEGGAITFTVTLSPSSSQYVWVHYYARPSYGAAASATHADFEQTYGLLTFNPGETSKTITVALTDDGVVEGYETFVVSLYNAYGAGQPKIGAKEAVGTIIDND